MRDLVHEYSFNPYSYYGLLGVSQDKILAALSREVQELAQKADQVIETEGGVAAYRFSDFDTRVLGLRTAKIDIFISPQGGELASKLTASLKESGTQYATVRISTEDIEAIQELEDTGFRTVDTYLVLLRVLNRDKREPQDVLIREGREEDIPSLQERIAPTFVYSRFFKDPLLAEKAAVKMHEEWIANSIRRKVAEHTLVAEVDGEPSGFITLEMDKDAKEYFNKKVGHIPLIGVDPNLRGKGVAWALTEAALAEFSDQGAEAVKIETQVANIPATRLYEKAGFRVVDSFQTLRWNSK